MRKAAQHRTAEYIRLHQMPAEDGESFPLFPLLQCPQLILPKQSTPTLPKIKSTGFPLLADSPLSAAKSSLIEGYERVQRKGVF